MKTSPIIYLFAILALLITSALTFPARVTSSKPIDVTSAASSRKGVHRARVLSYSSNGKGMSAQGDSSPAPTASDQISVLVLPGKENESANATGSSSSFATTQAALFPAQEPSTIAPEVIPIVGPVSLDQDLRTLPNIPQAENEDEQRLTRHPPAEGPVGISDPLRPIHIPSLPSAMPTPLQTFAGLTSVQCGCFPADTDGDIGRNHYIQAVNASFKIMDKMGTELVAPMTYNSLFSALGATTPCGNQNRGDGTVFYDQLADRWVISDFAWQGFPGLSYYQCIGVSKTADPVAGGWWLYALQVDPANPNLLGDYPKFGLWPDAYYMSVNMYSTGTTFNGVRVYALPRNAMINGTGAPNPAAIAFTIAPADLGDTYSLLPATFRSGLPPVSGGTVTPEYFMAINSSATAGTIENQVFSWRFHTDFATPANSTFGVGVNHAPDGTTTVNDFVDALTSSGIMIVPQTGTTTTLDSRGDGLMYPLVYQNLGGIESIYASHTINNNQNGTGPTAIRWYQFNVTGSTIPATPMQQQTFDNGGDGLWRFMPSLNIDGGGNLAIGYSESSGSTNPAIAYAGRLVTDPPNTLAQGEATVIQGAGHQTGYGRWGDYSSTFVDPSDNCTFWHTGEYFSVTSGLGWNTRIGTFKFPGCSQATPVTVPVALPNVAGAAIGSSVSIPITVSDLTGLGVRAYDLQVSFDPAVLQPLATPYDSSGTLSSGMFITPNTTNPGHLIISAFQATDLSGSGTLLKLRFSVVGAAGQSTSLTFQDYTDPNAGFHSAFRFNAGNPQASTTNGSLTVNTSPTITSSPVTRQAGSPISNSIVATVNDTESGAGGVTVTINGGASATVNGVTVSNIVNTNGTVTADLFATCTATNATFTLTATDGVGATPATLNVTVSANTAPTLVYSTPQSVIVGGSLNVTPTTATDNGSIMAYTLQSVVPTLTTAPTVDASGVVSVTNAQPSSSHVITIRATDNCGLITDTQFTLNVGALPSFAITDMSVSEGNTGTTGLAFTVTKTGNTALNATVDYVTVDGTATSPSDFTAITTTTLTFLPADISKTITVLVNGDTVFEPNESFNLNLTSATNATIADNQGVGTITNDDAQPTISINDVSVTEGNSGTSVAGFTVSLSNPSSQTITVNYATANNTATAGSDYVASSGTLTFTAGQTSQPISVTVNGDTVFEPNESFNLNLTSATNATIADNQGVGTITNDDAQPTISINDVSVTEGNSGTSVAGFTVSLSNASSQTVTVNYATANNTATAGSDYVASSGTLTFTAGQTSQPISVTVNGDTVFEPNESFNLNLTSATNATIADNQGVGTITNDDAQPTISINDVSVTEGNSGTSVAGFTVSLSNPSSQTITVNYATANNTATAGSDYVASSGTLTFTAGQTSQPISVTVNGDTVFEPNESFNLNLTSATNATIADNQGVGTITNDDAQPTISINDVSVTEGNSGTSVAGFTVSLSNASSQTVTVNYATANNTATAGSDYVASSGTLTFTAGQTSQPISVTVNGDTVFEPNESFNLNLTSATNATIADNQGVGTITNDDAQPTISINDVSVTEGNSGTSVAGFTVSLSNPSSQTITVNYATANNTATAGSDYVASSGTLTFTAGQTSQPISVTVNGDTVFEPNESFNLNLTSATNATIADNQGVGTITNDDASLISGRVVYTDTVTPVKNVTMTLTAPSFTTQTTTTDVNGNYTFAGVPAGNDYTVTPSKTGDVNGLESLDASDTARYVAGLAVPSANQRIAADADGDGILTSFDASLIARYVVGLPDAGIVGTWRFDPATRVYPAFGGDQTSQNFTAILVGDAGGNWNPSLPSGDRPSSSVRFDVNRSPFSATSPAVTVPVALPNVAGATIGSSVSIPITVSDLTGPEVRAYDLQVSFDPTVLQPLATPYDSAGTLSSGMFITPNGTNPGHLIISAFQATELVGSGTLLKLRFSVVGAAGQSTSLTFQDYTDPNAGFHSAFRFNAGNPQASTTNGSLTVNTTPTIQFDSATYSVGEGDRAVSVNLSRQGDTTAGASVSFYTGDSAGNQNCDVFNGIASLRCDYITSIGTLQFAPGEASKTVSILIVDDSYAEGNETFTVSLNSPSGSSLGTQSTATVTILDNDSVTGPNPTDVPISFVGQHYLDFLSRQPDTSGLAFWTNEITSCGTNQQCIEIKRISVSAAFYLSIEFQDTGYLVERFYKVTYGDANGTSTFGGTHQLSVPIIRLNEFLPDSQEIGRGVVVNQGNWQQQLEDNKNAFASAFVERSRFTAAFPNSMTAAQFVDKLNQNAGNPLSQSERDQLVTDLATNAKTRAQVLRAVAEDPDLVSNESNRAFVLMQYFGYLRRNPNDPQDSDYTGYDFWLTKLNQFNGNFVNAEMVKAFIASSEYRQRFGP